ncbi:MAG TPA: translation elongation factor Ts [Longimicrobium sp.]|nr:translation elongation factor Ts [Longimicrobium sp.]
MAISATDVKELRERTGAGMMECKKALEEANGEMETAIDILRAKGAAKAAKRADRETREGVIASYVHMGGKIGVLVEVNCETDFVARTDGFRELAKDVAMHVAAANPLAVTPEEIPAELVEREKAVFVEQVKNEGKPEKIWDRIVEGKLKKFYQDNALVEQAFVKDPDKTIAQLVTEASAKTGERIVIRRFARFALGE